VSNTSKSNKNTQCALRVIFKNIKKPEKIEKALKNDNLSSMHDAYFIHINVDQIFIYFIHVRI